MYQDTLCRGDTVLPTSWMDRRSLPFPQWHQAHLDYALCRTVSEALPLHIYAWQEVPCHLSSLPHSYHGAEPVAFISAHTSLAEPYTVELQVE